MVSSRVRSSILYAAIAIPVAHFIFESIQFRPPQFYYPPNLPPPPPGWDPSQGWEWLKDPRWNPAISAQQSQQQVQKVEVEKIAPVQPFLEQKPVIEEAPKIQEPVYKAPPPSVNKIEIPQAPPAAVLPPANPLPAESNLSSTDGDDNDDYPDEEEPADQPIDDYNNIERGDQAQHHSSFSEHSSFARKRNSPTHRREHNSPDGEDYPGGSDDARDARKAQRLALRMALKNDEPPPDDYFEHVPEFVANFETYSVLDESLNVRKITPAGFEREEAPLMVVNDNVQECQPDCPPGVFLPMPRSWYDDPEIIHPLTNYNYYLNPYDFCADQNEFKVIIMVRSLPWNFDRRKVIRSTWMQDVGKYQGDVKVLFYTGVDYHGGRQKMLNEEAQNFKDILQSDVSVDAHNVTYHYPSMYNWVDRYCSNVVYIMNIDDSVVPFIDAIMKGPLNPPPESYGYRDFQCSKIIARPKMDPGHTYVLTGEENKAAKYTRERLPAICMAYCMLMSRDVTRVLLYGSMTTKYLNIPDMDIAGITREKFSLDPPTDLLAGPYLCQHVDKKMSHTTEIAYDFQTIEERIAAAWEHTKDSPVSKNILKRIDYVIEKRNKQQREF